MATMAPTPQHKQQFETYLNGLGSHDEFLKRHIIQADQQQLFWQAGEVHREHERLCITLSEFALTIAISHRHETLEQSTLVFNHWRPELYETHGLMPPMHPTLSGEEAIERFTPLLDHSVAVFGLGQCALLQQDLAHAS